MLSDFKYGLRQMRKKPGVHPHHAFLFLGLGIGISTAGFNLYIDAVTLRALPVGIPAGWCWLRISAPRLLAPKWARISPIPPTNCSATRRIPWPAAAAAERYYVSLVASGPCTGYIAVPISIKFGVRQFFSVLGVPAFFRGVPWSRTTTGKALPGPSSSSATPSGGGNSLAPMRKSWAKRSCSTKSPSWWSASRKKGFFRFRARASRPDLWTRPHAAVLLNPNSSRLIQDPPLQHLSDRSAGCQQGVKLDSAHARIGRDLPGAGQRPSASIRVCDQRAERWGKDGSRPRARSGRLRLGLDHSAGGIQQLLVTLLVVVGLVLIISCANVGSLLLARTAGRQREFAVRAALRARASGRLARQLVVEGLLLSIAGGGLGLLTTGWFTRALASSFVLGPEGASSIDASINLGSDVRVLLFALAVSGLAGIFVGLIPALKFSQIDLVSAVKAQNSTLTSGSRRRLSRALVVVDRLGFPFASWWARGSSSGASRALRNVDAGFQPEEPAPSVTVDYSSYRLGHLAKDLLIVGSGTIPGIRSATRSPWRERMAATSTHPCRRPSAWTPYVYRAAGCCGGAQAYSVFAGPRYFESMGVSSSAAGISPFADVFPAGVTTPGSAPVAVISESTALKLFGSADPIGHYIGSPLLLSGSKAKIVGVARNTRWGNLRDDSRLVVFIPSTLSPRRNLTLVLRTEGNPLAMAQNVYALVKRIDPDAHIMSPLTMEDIADRQLFQERIAARVSGFCSVFALTLACLGLYGLLSYNVAQRTREIGLRMALGAQAGGIVSLVVSWAMGLALLGCAIGVAGAAALAHVIASRLYGVGATDPVTLVGTVAALVVVAFLACWLPRPAGHQGRSDGGAALGITDNHDLRLQNTPSASSRSIPASPPWRCSRSPLALAPPRRFSA